MMERVSIENRTFDEIHVGESASFSHTITGVDLDVHGVASYDDGPVDLGEGHAAAADGMLTMGLVSSLLGTKLPGRGTIYLGHELRFHRPVLVGDTITATVTAREKRAGTHSVLFDCACVDQAGQSVLTGTAEVEAPIAKYRQSGRTLPTLVVRRHQKYERLIARTKEIPAVRTVVAHPCDENSLRGAIEAAEADIIIPVLVGPTRKIQDAAAKAKLDISQLEIVATEHSHASAAKSVELIRSGRAELLMKGSLHTDELMREVTSRETGLRTERRISHVFIMDVPTHPEVLLITDAAVNIQPDLNTKRDIVQNAIDLYRGLGLGPPKIAILSAVETVTTKILGTIDAAALCKMADRGQITGGVLDGPLALDNAISLDAARIKGITSGVAGMAQILVVPDLEAGNMLAKMLTFLANADAAGIVLGARVPIMLTSRADTVRTRMASCAIAALYAHACRQQTVQAAE
jgi:phosphate acetyltransferase